MEAKDTSRRNAIIHQGFAHNIQSDMHIPENSRYPHHCHSQCQGRHSPAHPEKIGGNVLVLGGRPGSADQGPGPRRIVGNPPDDQGSQNDPDDRKERTRSPGLRAEPSQPHLASTGLGCEGTSAAGAWSRSRPPTPSLRPAGTESRGRGWSSSAMGGRPVAGGRGNL